MKPAFRLTPVIAALCCRRVDVRSGAQAQTIKIGVVGPTTGPVTQYGDMVREGVDTAVERINAAGGVNGKKLETVVIDDGCEPKQGPVAANRVVNSKIGFVVGHVCSGATIAAADVYNNEGVVMVTVGHLAGADRRQELRVHLPHHRPRRPARPGRRQVRPGKLKPKKVAVLHDKQSYGQASPPRSRTTSRRAASRSRSSKASTPATATTPPSSPSSRAAAWTSSTTAATTPKWACCCARRPNRA